MLFARLQRKSQRWIAGSVFRKTDYPPGEFPLVGFLCGEERGVGPAKAHWNAESLSRSHRNVGSPFSGRFQKSKG